MKILNINSSLDPISGGGTAERTMQMSRYLSMENNLVSILILLHRKTIQYQQSLTIINSIIYVSLKSRDLPKFHNSPERIRNFTIPETHNYMSDMYVLFYYVHVLKFFGKS